MFTVHALAAVLAHQGGWDELLLVGGPIVIIALLLVVANRRAKQLALEDPQKTPLAEDKPDTP